MACISCNGRSFLQAKNKQKRRHLSQTDINKSDGCVLRITSPRVQLIPLKVHAYINTTVFHQDLREVAASWVTLGCCYWWQKHTLLGPGTACLAVCAALCGHSTESHQICDRRAGKGGEWKGESHASSSCFPWEPALTAQGWAHAKPCDQRHRHSSVGTTKEKYPGRSPGKHCPTASVKGAGAVRRKQPWAGR